MKAWLLVLLLALPQATSGTFTISVNGLRAGEEEFTVVRNGTGFLATGRVRLRLAEGSMVAESRMELDGALNPVSYEYSVPNRKLRMDIGPDVTEVEISVDGQVTSYDIRFPAGAMIVDDNFFHHYQLLFDRLGPQGGAVQVFVPQQLTLGRIEVAPAGERAYDIQTENLRLRATTDGAGQLIRLAGGESGVVVERR